MRNYYKFFGLFLSLSATATSMKPQKLKSQIVKICGVSMKLELAKSENEIRTGLMHRSEVKPGTGMIFIFRDSKVLNFWMKNVPMDIDVGFFDEKGVLVSAQTMKGESPLKMEAFLPTYSSIFPAKYAVEVEKFFYKSVLKDKSLNNCTMHPLL